MGLLSLAIWTPIAVGAVLLALGRDQHVQPVRWLALIGALAAFLVTLPLYGGFEIGSAAMQHVEKVLWVPAFNIHYHLGVAFWKGGDRGVIEGGVVNASWKLVGAVSALVRRAQSGYLYHYALMMIVGVFLFMTYFVWLAK